jgi:preprotein translocase subunit SecE
MEKIKEFWKAAKQFFREVRVELKKVTWPSRKETIASTSVVLVTVILVAFFLGIVDLGLSRLIKIFLD